MEEHTQKTAVQKTEQQAKIENLKRYLNAESVREQFKNALNENANAFVASIIDLFNGDAALRTCEPKSIIMEALKAAVLKLPINKAVGFSYIVVFNKNTKILNPKTGKSDWLKIPTPTFVLGYRGYIQLALRTGQYRTINADVVYEGELVNANKLTGSIDMSGKKTSDKVIGYFAYIEMLNGYSKTLYMPIETMAAYAKNYSKSISAETTIDDLIKLANSSSLSSKVGWEGNFNSMAIKTVLRRLISKYGYLSIDMQKAYTYDVNSESESREAFIEKNANKKTLGEDVDFEETPVQKEESPVNKDNSEPEPEPEY